MMCLTSGGGSYDSNYALLQMELLEFFYAMILYMAGTLVFVKRTLCSEGGGFSIIRRRSYSNDSM